MMLRADYLYDQKVYYTEKKGQNSDLQQDRWSLTFNCAAEKNHSKNYSYRISLGLFIQENRKIIH